jgi:hypothetical protein
VPQEGIDIEIRSIDLALGYGKHVVVGFGGLFFLQQPSGL